MEDSLTLDQKQEELVLMKQGDVNRIAFATMLKFFELHGRPLTRKDKIPIELLECLGHQLGIDYQRFSEFNWHGISAKRFRGEIRAFLGYRKPGKEDQHGLIQWLMDHHVPNVLRFPQYLEHAYAFFKDKKREPFSADQMERFIKSAIYRFEKTFLLTVSKKISLETKKKLEGIMKESFFDELKRDIVVTKEIPFGIERLEFLRSLNLPKEHFQTVPRKFVHKFYLRALTQFSSHMAEYKRENFYGHLGAFCHYRSEQLTDNLVDLLLKRLKKIKSAAEVSVSKQGVKDIKKVDGKYKILYTLAAAAVEHPNKTVKQAIYPKVSPQKLGELKEELNPGRKGWFEEAVGQKMKSLYTYGHRRSLFPLIEALTFRSNTVEGSKTLEALHYIKKHKNDDRVYKSAPGVKEEEVNKFTYELETLETLAKQVECKIVWVEGAHRYRNPDRDMPQDFDDAFDYYCELLNLPTEAKVFIETLQGKHERALNALNDNMPLNDKVNIKEGKRGTRIKITKAKPQANPPFLKALQQYIKKRWKNISLLDVLKETDLRVNFTDALVTIGTRDAIESDSLKKRLLLCIYGVGSNTGLTRISTANDDVSYDDLKYTKGRYFYKDNIKGATVKVINAILRIRDPKVWGDALTGVACDSKHIRSWDQNLMTEWHKRYHKYGVMVYWHVDKKSMVVHSMLKTCLSSEVGSMLEGLLRHDTKMNIDKAYMDTHGQSVIGFGFGYCLHVNLLPRLKRMHVQKLYGSRKQYKNIGKLLKGLIDWNLIEENYHEVVRVVAALKTGTVEADVIIKRFSRDNFDHPVYRSLNEIGKAVKTLFLCDYLTYEDLRVEIQDSLNVVERVNSIMGFIFYGKLGELSSNNRNAQELSIACLHLLQVSMVYINTLIIQEALKMWKGPLTKEDLRALTPLIHSHINPYGLFPLNMNERLEIEEAA